MARSPVMDVPDRWVRWAPLSGFVFGASFLALYFAFFVPGEVGTRGADATQIAEYYQGRGAAGLLLMYYLIGLAGVAIVGFSAGLAVWLVRAEPAPGRIAFVAFGGGVGAATLFLAGGATLVAPFTMVVVNSAEAIEPIFHETLSTIGFTAINFGLLSGALMVVATSIVALHGSGAPAWFGWLGLLVAVALAANILYFFGLFVWVGWVLLASGLLLTRPAAAVASGGQPVVAEP